MKKFVLPFFSCLLVLTLLLGSFGSAKAEIGDDPVVTPVSGDMEFTTEVVPIASLPGLAEYDQMLVPIGFPEGEAQFEGAGVLVTKFDAGKANACFTISGTQWGWGGKVGMWDGTKWALLPTTIKTTGDDGTSTTACANITGSGTYAFIKYVVDSDKLPKELPVCKFNVQTIYVISSSEFGIGITTPDTYPLPGTPFRWRVIEANPQGSVQGPLSGNATVAANNLFDMNWTYPLGPYWTIANPMSGMTLRIDFDFCYTLVIFGSN